MSVQGLMGPIGLSGAPRWWIADVAVLRPEAPGGQERRPIVHLPDPSAAVVFRTAGARRGDVIVLGPRTSASYFVGKDFPVCLKIRLSPGAARPVLGVPVRELVDQVVSLRTLWPASDAERLARRLAEAGDDPDRILDHLDAALRARIANQTEAGSVRSDLVRAAAAVLAQRRGGCRLSQNDEFDCGRESSSRGSSSRDSSGRDSGCRGEGDDEDRRSARIPALARRFAVSERHLRELFVDGVGLSPKRFERIVRVRRVIASCGGARAPRWAHVAAAVGYYDQSHMTAEFRSVMGVPPAAYFSDRLPSPEPC